LHPIASVVDSYQRLDSVHTPEPFLGAITNRPARYYFAVYLAATLPVGAALGVAVGAVRMIRARDRSALIVACCLLAPLGAALSPVRQDGVRYVMPCLLALAVVAAAGFDQIALWLRLRHAFTAIATAALGYLAVVLAGIHPYYLDYFNEAVGGAGHVAARRWFETAWWGEGVDRAVDYVNAHAAPAARVHRDCIEPVHLAWFREDLWTPMTSLAKNATWIVAYAPETRRCAVPPDARAVFTVTADGVVLAVVYQRDPAGDPAAPSTAPAPSAPAASSSAAAAPSSPASPSSPSGTVDQRQRPQRASSAP
jgi:hypothetical protein